MKLLVTFSFLVLLILTGCDALDSITGTDDSPATLSGRVTSASTSNPSYPATVALLDGSADFDYASVNTDGRYRFRSVEPGTYVLVLSLGNRGGVREALRETIVIAPGSNVRDFVVP